MQPRASATSAGSSSTSRRGGDNPDADRNSGVTLGVRGGSMTTMPVSEPLDAARLAALRAGAERTFAELVGDQPADAEAGARLPDRGGNCRRKQCRRGGSLSAKFRSVCGPLFARDVGSGHCLNVARARGRHEARSGPFSSAPMTSLLLIQTVLADGSRALARSLGDRSSAVARGRARDRGGRAGHPRRRGGAAAGAAGSNRPMSRRSSALKIWRSGRSGAGSGACFPAGSSRACRPGTRRGASQLAAGRAEGDARNRRPRLSEPELRALRRAGLVHDLGRLGVSNWIWDKPGALGAGEWERVRLHPHITERMLH